MSALRQARVNPLLSPSPQKVPLLAQSRSAGTLNASGPMSASVSFQTPLAQRMAYSGSSGALGPFVQVQPTPSGRQSGQTAAEMARHAATRARATQQAVQRLQSKTGDGPERSGSSVAGRPIMDVPRVSGPPKVRLSLDFMDESRPPGKAAAAPPRQMAYTPVGQVHQPQRSTPAISFEPVDAEALHTFSLLDADGSGAVDLDELRRAVQKLEAVGIAEGLLAAIDLNADGRLARAEWVDHFNEMARTNGRQAAVSYLHKLDACAILQQPLNRSADSPSLRGMDESRQPQSISVESVQAELREALTANFARVMDLFRIWDADGNGTISKKEFRKAIRALRVSASVAEVDSVFATWDRDGSGSISSRELSKILRRAAGGDIELPPELQAGAVGEIKLKSENDMALRKSQRDGPMARTGITASLANIKIAMKEDRWRTKDMMNVLDQNDDGRVTARDFLSVIPVLGFDVAESEELLQLFRTFDADASGAVDFEELHAALRKQLDD